MRHSAILDNRLTIRLDLNPSWSANTVFQSDVWNQAHLANQLLLYEQVLIPTQDMAIASILLGWLGSDLFLESMEAGIFVFLKRKNRLGYGGNIGICEFIVQSQGQNELAWWNQAIFGEPEEALELQLAHACPSLSPRLRSKLVAVISANSRAVAFKNDTFIQAVEEETYRDVMRSESLLAYVAEDEHKTCAPGKCDIKETNLKNLRAITPRELRVLGNDGIRDAVDLLVRIAEINSELLLAETFGNPDILPSWGAEEILASKFDGLRVSYPAEASFQRLLELNEIPDIGRTLASGQIALSDVWKARNCSSARVFREWFRQNDYGAPGETERRFVTALKESGMSSFPMRAVRFVLTNAAQAIQPLGGLVVGAIDSFFVDKWLRGFSPCLFIDDLAKFLVRPKRRSAPK